MAEDLINALAHVDGIQVAARTSAVAFKGQNRDVREIGRLLDVGSVLEGSVRRAGNRLRITAQLVRVADGMRLWSERFDRQLDDVFAIQDEISLTIVDRLKVRLFPVEEARVVKRHTVDPEAHSLYLKGRYFYALFLATRERVDEAIQQSRIYPGLEPLSPIANGHAGQILYHAARYPEAIGQLMKAIDLDPDLPFPRAWLMLALLAAGRTGDAHAASEHVSRVF